MNVLILIVGLVAAALVTVYVWWPSDGGPVVAGSWLSAALPTGERRV